MRGEGAPPTSRGPASGQQQDKAYLKLGYAITEAVQSYNIIYQAITDTCTLAGFEITSEELGMLTQSLDNAIAEVVSEFERAQSEKQGEKETERLGFLAHELRNSLQSASIALEMIESGSVGVKGKTGGLLKSSLQRMAELIDTALTGVRLRIEPAVDLKKFRVFDVISEVEITAGFQARARNIKLKMPPFSKLEIHADRHLFISALANLVQNALKFSKVGGIVEIRTIRSDDRILIEVEDECGGLPEGKVHELFDVGVQESHDRTGVGLGLAISRQAIERNNGLLHVRDLPGKGCVFTIDMPKAGSTAAVKA